MNDRNTFDIFHDGKPIRAHKGQSVAEALLEAGVDTFRITRNRAHRGPFCNMGVCFECRMVIDGAPNTRACMTEAVPGRRSETQDDAAVGGPDEER